MNKTGRRRKGIIAIERNPLNRCLPGTYRDCENVQGTGLVVQTLEGVDGAQSGVDAEEAHAAGIDGALQGVGQLVVLIAV